MLLEARSARRTWVRPLASGPAKEAQPPLMTEGPRLATRPLGSWQPPDRAALQNPRKDRLGLRDRRAIQGRPGDRGEGRFGALAVAIGNWEAEAAGCTSPEAKRRVGRDRHVFVEVDGERIESPISSGSKRNQAAVLEANLRATCAEQVGIDSAFVMRRCVLHAMQAVKLQLESRVTRSRRPACGRRSRWSRADAFSKHGGSTRSKRALFERLACLQRREPQRSVNGRENCASVVASSGEPSCARSRRAWLPGCAFTTCRGRTDVVAGSRGAANDVAFSERACGARAGWVAGTSARAWSGRWDSNPRLAAPKAAPLPTEVLPA